MANLSLIEYTGQVQPEPGEYNDIIKRLIYPYYPDEKGQLVEAVNLAIRLNRPLLLEGEPGCGKSHLAHALVYEFSRRSPEITWRFRYWNIQSTSKAMDGFYSYDYIGRLQEAQLKQAGVNDTAALHPENFVSYGALGHSFKDSHEGIRTIVLIDEIDKADPDLPNDLLLALDAQEFEIKEISDTKENEPKRLIKACPDFAPIILITSNEERSLPAAFLRRCLYHYIEPPTEKELIQILVSRFICPKKVAAQSVKSFLDLREQMEDKGEMAKKVSTSELIDWFAALYDPKTQQLRQKLEPNKSRPFLSALLKSRQDRLEYS